MFGGTEKERNDAVYVTFRCSDYINPFCQSRLHRHFCPLSIIPERSFCIFSHLVPPEKKLLPWGVCTPGQASPLTSPPCCDESPLTPPQPPQWRRQSKSAACPATCGWPLCSMRLCKPHARANVGKIGSPHMSARGLCSALRS
ncbi:hypothetical protein LX36DRAFT_146278 [Colletotrichum falcatum]|nr:hypothetical protein LX36DRAFT_146278 [Colletotrichum falcatum]